MLLRWHWMNISFLSYLSHFLSLLEKKINLINLLGKHSSKIHGSRCQAQFISSLYSLVRATLKRVARSIGRDHNYTLHAHWSWRILFKTACYISIRHEVHSFLIKHHILKGQEGDCEMLGVMLGFFSPLRVSFACALFNQYWCHSDHCSIWQFVSVELNRDVICMWHWGF